MGRGGAGSRPGWAGLADRLTGRPGPVRCRLGLGLTACRCPHRTSILSEVSTRARSKLPSGKNILVFGERRRRGVAQGAGVGEVVAPLTGPSLPLPCRLPAACLARGARRPRLDSRRLAGSTTPEVGVLPLTEIPVMLACGCRHMP